MFTVVVLLQFGVDVNRPNASDQTALDIVEKFTTMKGSVELKQLLKSKFCAGKYSKSSKVTKSI